MKRSRLVPILVLTVLTVVGAALPSVAAPPSREACSSPTLTGPAEAQVGDTYTINGCGFKPGTLVPLEITEADGCCLARNILADESGSFTYTDDVWASGTYRVRASELQRNKRWRVVAVWQFEAYG